MKKVELPEELEMQLLKAVSDGLILPTALSRKELSKHGKLALKVVDQMLESGGTIPLDSSAIIVAARSLYGVYSEEWCDYICKLSQLSLNGTGGAIVKLVQDKQMIANLMNEGSKQSHDGKLDLEKFRSILSLADASMISSKEDGLESIAALLTQGWVDIPHGIPIRSLKEITETSRGLFGIWCIAGEPGLGKSTLAWQIALDIGREIPVLYYDLDGTGQSWFLDRLRQIFKGDIEKCKERTKLVHLKPSIETFEQDLANIPPPALIVIDSAQTLPTMVKWRKSGIDDWLVRFKGLSKQGYHFLLISEVARGMYGQVGLAAFKESGSFEYTGTFCAVLIGDSEEEDEPVEFHVVKNRHGPKKGHIVDLERDPVKHWWFKEV